MGVGDRNDHPVRHNARFCLNSSAASRSPGVPDRPLTASWHPRRLRPRGVTGVTVYFRTNRVGTLASAASRPSSVLDAGGPGRRLEPQAHYLRRERHDAVLGRGPRRRLQRPDRAGDGALHDRTSIASPSWFVFPRRTVMRTPARSASSSTVGPSERRDLAPAHPGHEEQPHDDGIKAAALESDLLGTRGRGGVADGRWRGRRRGPPPRTAAPGPGVCAVEVSRACAGWRWRRR